MKETELSSPWSVGIARRKITPAPDVDLGGLGYYLHRTPQSVRDDLAVTALVVQSHTGGSLAIAALDVIYCDAEFVRAVRNQVAAQTSLPPTAICINCSHSHNAPTLAFARGLGELNPAYVQLATRQTVAAIVQAWREQKPARLRVGATELRGYTFNRTRENGPVDPRLSVLRADTLDGRPLAVAFNYHTHLTAHLEVDLRAVSRDWPGEVIDQVEAALPGATAIYLQGTCGDVMLSPEFNSTARRFEPARAITQALFTAMESAVPVGGNTIEALVQTVRLPTRRWTREEITRDREEGLYRLQTGDTKGWLDGFARVIVTYPQRLPLRYGGSVDKAVQAVSQFAVEWTDAILPVLDTRPEYLDTEIQVFQLGSVLFAAHSAELYTTLGLEIRDRAPTRDLFLLGYSNGGIAYLPDAYDVERKSYAAYQSPKFIGQFPFVAASGREMVNGIVTALDRINHAG